MYILFLKKLSAQVEHHISTQRLNMHSFLSIEVVMNTNLATKFWQPSVFTSISAVLEILVKPKHTQQGTMPSQLFKKGICMYLILFFLERDPIEA